MIHVETFPKRLLKPVGFSGEKRKVLIQDGATIATDVGGGLRGDDGDADFGDPSLWPLVG